MTDLLSRFTNYKHNNRKDSQIVQTNDKLKKFYKQRTKSWLQDWKQVNPPPVLFVSFLF